MPEPTYTLDDLLPLVRSFVAGNLTGPEFTQRYMETFKDLQAVDPQVFEILDQLFVDADDYYDDPDAPAEQRQAAADQITGYARAALDSIENA